MILNDAFAFGNLVDLARHRAHLRAGDAAYTFVTESGEEETLCYGRLDEAARAIAHQLKDEGLTGQRALLAFPPGLRFVEALFGCFYGNVVAVPVYPPRTAKDFDRLAAIGHDCEAAALLTTRAGQDHLQQSPISKFRVLATDGGSPAHVDWTPPVLDRGNTALLQYTSGSTGTPKGVVVSHGNLLHNLEVIHRRFDHDSTSRGVIWLPQYHDMGLVGGVLEPMYSGFRVWLMSPLYFLQKPVRWLEAITRYGGTTSGGPSFAYDLCVRKITPEQRERLDLRTWSVAFNGAEPVRADVLERFASTFAPHGFRREAFYPCYGMAEATLMVTGGRRLSGASYQVAERGALEQGLLAPAEAGAARTTLVSCGQPSLGQRVVIVDPETRYPMSDGRVGEIWVAGESVCSGYWNATPEVSDAFDARLAGTGEGPFFRTGDLGLIKDGDLFVTGRIKELIILHGKNHYPHDIERSVEQSNLSLRPGSGVAFSIDVDDEERLVVVHEVDRAHLRALNVDGVLADMRQAVSLHHGINAHAVVLIRPAALPKTSSGKPQRRAARTQFMAGTLDIVGTG